MNVKNITESAFEEGEGIVRLAPNWVPRSFCIPKWLTTGLKTITSPSRASINLFSVDVPLDPALAIVHRFEKLAKMKG